MMRWTHHCQLRHCIIALCAVALLETISLLHD